MKNLKIISLSILTIIGYSIQILPYQQNDVGQTELIQFIIQQEELIQKAKKEVNELDDICYEKITRYHTHVAPSDRSKVGGGSSARAARIAGVPYTTTSSTKKVKRDSCTTEQVEALKRSEEKLEQLIASTNKQIEIIAADASQLAVKDNFGKTALNYCYTKAIYNKLREVGVPFQYDAWLYFHGGMLAFAGAATAILGKATLDHYLK